MPNMWKCCAGLMLLLATACATGERPGAVLRRDFPSVEIQRLGGYDSLYAGSSDRAALDALHRTVQAGIPKDKIEKVTLRSRVRGGKAGTHELWLRIAGCDKLVYMGANFNGRVVAVEDEGGCLKPTAEILASVRRFSFAPDRALIPTWTKIWRTSFARRLTRPRVRGVTIPVRPSMP